MSAKFSLIERCGINADLRSPGTYEIPNLIASAGCLKTTFLPLTRISPESGFACPAKISNKKSWPWPSSAATPSTSPRLISNETSVRFLPPERLTTSSKTSDFSELFLAFLDALATLFFSPSIAETILSSICLVASNESTSIPSLKTVAQSQMLSISASLCEMKITDLPLAFWAFIISITLSAKSMGSAAVISSKIRSSGSWLSALARSIIRKVGSSILEAISFKLTDKPIASISLRKRFSLVPVKAKLRWSETSGINAGS